MGLLWGVWHFPFIIYYNLAAGPGPLIASLLGLTMGIIGWTIVNTWLYNNTESVWIMILLHGWGNAVQSYLVSLNVDPVLIRQALFKLIHNAILAAPESQVQVEVVLSEHQRVPGVMLSVTDAGPGFSKETADKLFKPFFTTRASGTGLGLSVAQHIAMKHGGVVLAENLPKGGAKFSIWLPMVRPS